MYRSRALCASLVLAFGTAGLGVSAAPPAAALTPPVAFTADDLPTWQTNGVVWALAQAGDTIFVGGTFSQVRPPNGETGDPQNAVNFVAMNAATGKPTSCRLSFAVGSGTATVRALAVSPDQKTLYVGGYFGSVNGVQTSSFAAIDIASCAPRPGFHAAFPATVRAIAATSDTLYVGGDFSTADSQPRKRFAALDATTGGVLPFRADADEPGRAVAVSEDGKYVALGGDFFYVNGHDSHALAVVDATTGANVQSYRLGFFSRTSVVKTIDADADGFYTGNEGTGGGVFDGRTALDASTFDQRWRDTCLGATQSVLAYDSVLYSASHAHDCSTMDEFPDGRRHHLMAEPTDDPTLLGWFPDTNDGIGEGIGPRAMTIATSGTTKYLWVGGEFTTVNGSPGQGLTRFASGPDIGVPWVPDDVSVDSARADRVRISWRSSIDTDDSVLTYKVYRDGAATPVYTVNGESFEWSRPRVTFNDTDVERGEKHSYQVTATDGAGNTSGKSAALTVTVPNW
ncbi:fibronectin type III domain-containing protein [Streptomyces odontomachi]|uniref:fibronectin type III domain-containing protein n=1 Tax=Streptomyces odontomachi TaxID=2944940 RepID=UPI002109A433|nr:fibronectin type III domain-containing protein [Streptomyces sp. ODS25]